METRPFYRRSLPRPQNAALFATDRIDLTSAHLPPYPNPSRDLEDSRSPANTLFDARAAAAVCASVDKPGGVSIDAPPGKGKDGKGARDFHSLLESKFYADIAPSIFVLTPKCLAAMAYADYMQDDTGSPTLRDNVSAAIMRASPGWCGTFGPDVNDQGKSNFEGNYDLTQMWLLPIAYAFYKQLAPDAQERLITLLLARGRIHRASIDGADDGFTSGGTPSDWATAGFVSLGPLGLVPVPETENHVLMIATARYLTNQLLWQRFGTLNFDNRRNGDGSRPDCMEQVVGLLRSTLQDGFAEYNAKPYQEETRHALLCLCSYAYDAEVRVGARMVLDLLSAQFAVSSNDLRRLVPFRRRMEKENVRTIPDDPGFIDVSLLDTHGADPISAQFALLAGNTRAYRDRNPRKWPDETDAARPFPWEITRDYGQELTFGAVSDYRLPPSIHDLFVNDLHRRFYQRQQKHVRLELGLQHNCDNLEIYAGSPSYLITAGSKPTMWVIPGVTVLGIAKGYQDQNLGFAMPTSFMPTGMNAAGEVTLTQLAASLGMTARPVSLTALAQRAGVSAPFSLRDLLFASGLLVNVNNAAALIQLSPSSAQPLVAENQRAGLPGGQEFGLTENYGVAPDFACGLDCHLPAWTGIPKDGDGLFFIDRKSRSNEPAGFFLALQRTGRFVFLEAFDTWLHPEVTFAQFQEHVTRDNPGLQVKNNQEAVYTTFFGNKIHFVIWGEVFPGPSRDGHIIGSKILRIEYGPGDPRDTLADAGNAVDPAPFLSGTVLKSTRDAVVEIHNTFLGTKLTLDWSDLLNPVRTSEDGTVEQGGHNHEVWVDFDGTGPSAGDFFSPFHTVTNAAAGVADRGVIRIMPGKTRAAKLSGNGKRIRLVAPIGGVTISAE